MHLVVHFRQAEQQRVQARDILDETLIILTVRLDHYISHVSGVLAKHRSWKGPSIEYAPCFRPLSASLSTSRALY